MNGKKFFEFDCLPFQTWILSKARLYAPNIDSWFMQRYAVWCSTGFKHVFVNNHNINAQFVRTVAVQIQWQNVR